MDLINFVLEIQQRFLNFLNQEFKSDKEVDSWMFMSTPWLPFSILAAYMLFVLKFGPKMMENREPFNIKYIMMTYNLLQTMHNIFIISVIFTTPGILNYIFNNMCHPDYTENNRSFKNTFNRIGWHYIISKFLDLLDTVFFVLRKKQSHVSFLHVYHHVNMVVTVWTYMRFFKGQQAVPCAILNSFVHSIMYSYYFLSAFGPHMQKYLWWKKYLTRLQIIQFIIGLIYAIVLFVFNCDFPRIFCVYMVFNLALFLHLFLVFYKKTYNEEKTKSQ